MSTRSSGRTRDAVAAVERDLGPALPLGGTHRTRSAQPNALLAALNRSAPASHSPLKSLKKNGKAALVLSLWLPRRDVWKVARNHFKGSPLRESETADTQSRTRS